MKYVDTYDIPEWAIYALEYGTRETEGLTDEDIADIENFTGKWALNIPSSFEHGTITCEKDWAYTNETVTLTVTPDQGYELESLTIEIIDNSKLEPNEEIAVIPGDEPGTYTFTMPASPVTVNATFQETTVTGIEDINAAQPKASQRYNLMGQPVGKDYKGIVIEKGKIIIVR